MKNVLLLASLGISLISTGVAASSNGIYVTGKLGSSIVDIHDSSLNANDGFNNQTTRLDNKNKGVFGGGGALGYDFNDQYNIPVRIELDLAFRNDAKAIQDVGGAKVENKVRMDTYMLNGYYDFHNTSDFTPYLSAGVGMAHLNLKHAATNSFGPSNDINQSASANNLAWSVGAGVKYSVTSNIAIDASYRYVDGGKVDGTERIFDVIDYTTKAKAASNDLMLGVTYNF